MDKFSFFIDRGGTFTDVYAQLLSEDPANYEDAPTEGIRRILEEVTGEPHPKGQPLDTSRIQCIRMGTTVATNALLERRGEPCVLVTTRGFRDLLRIGNQSRPSIFDLEIQRPDVLFSSVIEVDERLTLRKEAEMPGEVVEGSTGQELVVERPLDEDGARAALQAAFDAGTRSVAVVLLHGYLVDRHERRLGELAREIGFPQVSLSSEVMPMVKMVPRGFTTCADAYLSPRIAAYLDSFCTGFDASLRHRVQLHFMQSDGGLAPIGAFSGHKAVLSGPAGGVVGYARTTAIPADDEDVVAGRSFDQVIGFDMGGTSTDCSRYAGAYEHVYETTTAGVTIQAPQLDISTVAAGGGSRLFFRSGLFLVGPESVGAHPGPVCYRKGGQLAVTDANLVLGRIVPEFFPAIFGPHEDQPLDRQGALAAFQGLAGEVNAHSRKHSEQVGQGAQPPPPEKSVAEVAHGFLRVANEAMCRPIRELTQMKGFDITTHALACFGGAGGQHACAIARALGMRKIFIHRFSGILSAYGMGLADVTKEEQEPAAETLEEASAARLGARLAALSARVRAQLEEQGVAPSRVRVQHYLNLRYQGTDSAVMMRGEDDSAVCDAAQFLHDFEEHYRREFGFTLQRPVLVDDIRARGIGSADALAPPHISPQQGPPPVIATTQTYFEGGWRGTRCYRLRELGAGARVEGPAIVVDATSTILVEPGCVAQVTKHGDVVISVGGGGDPAVARVSASLDPIQLSIFSHRFMGIAEQMGRTLQRTSVSVNIKERLDFSCALFGPDGGLVANAPHIPVHLGAMQESVRFQLQRWGGDLEDGDVLVSNHPQLAGGSHLPDITVMTPVFDGGRIVFWVASRGHHADIGGVAPGSMPPLSHSLAEEGAAIVALKLVRRGEFDEAGVTAALMAPGSVPGCSGTRNLRDNLSDLKAQVAANRRGIALVRELIAEYGLDVVHAYMAHIQSNAEEAVRDMLREFAARRGLGERGAVAAADCMDDGSPIQLRMQVDGTRGSAVLGFEGTGPQVLGNTNAPPAVTQSAVIYVLRCLAGRDIPLNQGCLHPIEIRIPPRSLLHPSPDAAVVGGNVLTSQRVVDVVLRAFGACAASQGCMNNFTFGDATLGYYETIAGGAGAGPSWHGQSGVHTHMTNTRITDPEVLESRYPVLLRRFELRHGSGGAGRFRGGCGVVREVECRRPLTVSILSERRAFAPYGLEGGECGARGLNLVRRGDTGLVQSIGGKNTLELAAGDAIVIHTPGGGGFGRADPTAASSEPPHKPGEAAAHPPTRHGGGSIGKLREAEATM